MRKQFLTVLLPVLVVVLITASAQTQSAGTDAPKHAALQEINVVRTSEGFSVEISARGALKPQLSTLDSPARIVVDLPNTVVATSRGHISVDGDGVKDVRLAMDGQGASRVVVDLNKACRHELVAGSDNTLVLKLYTKSEVAQASRPAAVKAPVAQPVVAKSEVAVAPVVAELTAPAKEAKLIQTSAHATDFAFIEPSYSPKAASDDTKAAAIEPPARAVTAAGKFVSRPDGNLLPPASAAM